MRVSRSSEVRHSRLDDKHDITTHCLSSRRMLQPCIDQHDRLTKRVTYDDITKTQPYLHCTYAASAADDLTLKPEVTPLFDLLYTSALYPHAN